MMEAGRRFLERPLMKTTLALIGATVGATWVTEQLRVSNPALTEDQIHDISRMIVRLCDEWHSGRPVRQQLRSVVALAVPDGDRAFRLGSLLLDQWHGSGNGARDSSASASAAVSELLGEVVVGTARGGIGKMTAAAGGGDSEAARLLVSEFGCAADMVARLPADDGAVNAIVQALKSAPTCPITLEDLVTDGGRVAPGTAALFQVADGRVHAFLYQRQALERWLNSSPNPRDPLTRRPLSRREFHPIS